MKVKKNTRKRAQLDLFPLLLSATIALLACYAFSLKWPGTLVVFLPACGILYPGLKHFLRGKNSRSEAREFLLLLDYLSAAISAGNHIEPALRDAAVSLRADLRPRSRLLGGLEKAARELHSGLSLTAVMDGLRERFDLPEAVSFARILPEMLRSGGKADLFIQLFRDRFQKEEETLNELAATQSSTSSECLIMSCMPFLMAAIGKTIPAYAAAFQSQTGQVLHSFACLFGLLLLSLSLKLMVFSSSPKTAPDKRFFPTKPHPLLLRRQFAGRCLRLYPADLGQRLRHSLFCLFPGDSLIWEKYCQLKLSLSLAALLLLLFAALVSNSPLPLLLLPLSPLLLDLKIAQSRKECAEAEREQYPAFLNLMAVLLSAGLSPDRSLRLALTVLKEKTNGRRVSLLSRDLQQAERLLRSGASASQILETMAAGQSRSEISQVLRMMARYEREGGREQLNMIRIQAMQSAEIYRLAMRSRLSRRGLLYLLPMGLDLLLVIGITAWPALQNLNGSF